MLRGGCNETLLPTESCDSGRHLAANISKILGNRITGHLVILIILQKMVYFSHFRTRL